MILELLFLFIKYLLDSMQIFAPVRYLFRKKLKLFYLFSQFGCDFLFLTILAKQFDFVSLLNKRKVYSVFILGFELFQDVVALIKLVEISKARFIQFNEFRSEQMV